MVPSILELWSIICLFQSNGNGNSMSRTTNLACFSGETTSGSGTTSLAWTYMKVCGYSDSFCKNLNQRSLTPRWPLTPHLLRSYVWLYPRIIVSKSHENTSKYVDTFFAKKKKKTWTKGHWPLDDLWPHICWGHMCDSTQGSLCPSPMKIHQSMWIQWPFCKNLKQRSLTPRWPLTHICWGHRCDSTQRSLCPSPMKIH